MKASSMICVVRGVSPLRGGPTSAPTPHGGNQASAEIVRFNVRRLRERAATHPSARGQAQVRCSIPTYPCPSSDAASCASRMAVCARSVNLVSMAFHLYIRMVLFQIAGSRKPNPKIPVSRVFYPARLD
jgi:hypothetical protein